MREPIAVDDGGIGLAGAIVVLALNWNGWPISLVFSAAGTGLALTCAAQRTPATASR